MTTQQAGEALGPEPSTDYGKNPWLAMLAMCVGFFMILVDMTIVAVAQPAIQSALGADFNSIVWVTSAYLLTYAVPLLVAGRLGDEVGAERTRRRHQGRVHDRRPRSWAAST